MGEKGTVNACPRSPLCLVAGTMNDGGVSASLDRAQRALDRIERALANRPKVEGRDEALRAKVREAVAELDALIREAGR
jgi:hypothetical protein